MKLFFSTSQLINPAEKTGVTGSAEIKCPCRTRKSWRLSEPESPNEEVLFLCVWTWRNVPRDSFPPQENNNECSSDWSSEAVLRCIEKWGCRPGWGGGGGYRVGGSAAGVSLVVHRLNSWSLNAAWETNSEQRESMGWFWVHSEVQSVRQYQVQSLLCSTSSETWSRRVKQGTEQQLSKSTQLH